MHNLSDFIILTNPVLSRDALADIFATIADVEWRVPEHMGYERSCTTFPISAAVGSNYPVPEGKLDRVKQADQMLLDASLRALRVYKEKFPDLYTKADQGFDILRYETSQQIAYHADDNQPRVLSMSIALNDDYEGGEFRFWKRTAATVRVSAGCAIMFPPNFMFPHEILPVTRGTRYSMITWFV